MKASLLVAAIVVASACSADARVEQERQTPPDQRATVAQVKPTTPEQKAPAGVNQDAHTMQDFNERIAKYVEVHKQAKKGAPPLKETNDASKIKEAQDALAANIRAARATAKAGDIFTPDIRNMFRRLLYPEMKGEDGRDAKQVLKDDAPESVPLKVNAKYPENAPLPTVPAKMLINLPRLPEEVEYRIVGKHLILRDASADIIVDFIPNVIK